MTVVTFEPPRERTLRPEMTTTVQIAVDRRSNVLTCPPARGAARPRTAFVMTPAGGSGASCPIGSRDEAFCEIVDGLRDGDEVLVGEAGPRPDAP